MKRDESYNYIVNTRDVCGSHLLLELLHEFVQYYDGFESTIHTNGLIEASRCYFYNVPYQSVMQMVNIMVNARTLVETQSCIGPIDGDTDFGRGCKCKQAFPYSYPTVYESAKSITAKMCDWCHVTNSKDRKLKLCKGCGVAAYCCRKHQKLQWKKSHRFVCGVIGSWQQTLRSLGS